jgi:hypothetical protein
MRKWIVAIGIAVLLVIGGFYAIAPVARKITRDRMQVYMSGRFESDVQFSDLHMSLFPRIHVTFDNLVMRYHGRTDIPPLFQARTVSFSGDLVGMVGHRPHVQSVWFEGLQIQLPPRQHDGKPKIPQSGEDIAKKYPLVVDEVHADDALLVMLRAKPGGAPLEFPIHHLEADHVSFDSPAAYHALLTNPVPKADIDSTGTVGPWDADEPGQTPVDAQYTLQHADLGTFKGIKGILSSQGKFKGPLDYLEVEGETYIPDFALRMSDHPMAMRTNFSALVDGTNGDTYLKSVEVKFLNTSLTVTGEIVDFNPAVKGRTILLNATSENARIEDLLLLTVKYNPPMMTGAARLKTQVDIPEGDEDLLDRLKLKGQFGASDARFTSPSVQGKIETLSRKAQGNQKDADTGNGASELQGGFQLDKGVITFSQLSFSLTGASLELNGTYNIESSEMNFHGQLRMQAKLSQMTTGKKSFLLKAIDPLFKGKHAGTVVPIEISGTKDNPSFGIDLHIPKIQK